MKRLANVEDLKLIPEQAGCIPENDQIDIGLAKAIITYQRTRERRLENFSHFLIDMGGYMGKIARGSGDDDEEFDPHKHRKILKPTTYAETMTHMLKGACGAGLLAMPNAIMRMGVILGIVGTLLLAMFATYCIQLLIYAMYEVCKKHKVGYMSYMDCLKTAVKAGPPVMRWSANIFGQGVDVMLFILQIGGCAVYFVFVAENVKQVLDFYEMGTSVRNIICCLYPLAAAACFVKNLKWMAPLSSASNACTIFGVILVFFYLIEDDIIVQDEKLQIKGIQEVPIFIGIVLFALEAPGVMIALEHNMGKPKQFTGVLGLFSIGMAIITVLYILLGLVGYLKYGAESQGSITLNLPANQKKAQTAKLVFGMALYMSYPLQNYVAWEIMWRKSKSNFKPSNRKVADYVIRFICATIPFGCAVTAPKLGPFIGLVGALGLSLVAVVFPAVMDMGIYYPNQYGFAYHKFFIDLLIIIFGTFCLFSGVYTSMLEIYTSS